MTKRPKTSLIIVVAVFVCSAAWACSVPVFRYALERWEPDPYTLTMFHRGPLTPEAKAVVDVLVARAESGDARPNLRVRTVDIDGAVEEDDAALWQAQKDAQPPWAVLLAPPLKGDKGGCWSGPLDQLAPDALLDSPKRQEIAKLIVEGASSVWVLLDSGDAAKDKAAEERLDSVLAEMEKTLRLPDMTDDPVLESASPPDISGLRIDFPVVRVSRMDPAETMLTRMLTGSEPDLAGFDEPMAFPVYGRGRVLFAFVGAGINADTVGKACAFLVGRCSCEIKEDNPGTDLLMTVDWEGALGGVELIREIELPPLPGTAAVAVETPETVKAPKPMCATPDEPSASQAMMRNIALAAVGVITIVLVASLVLMKKPK